MTGKIIKGIAGFYYVQLESDIVYECKAKGGFRKDNIKPLVGDNVEIDIIDEGNFKGNIIDILPRMNSLIRPAVANVDQALVIFAATHPEVNLNLLDRFLVMMESQHIPVIICFNKIDLVDESFVNSMRQTYEKAGYEVLFTSAYEESGIEAVKERLQNKTTTVAGPSGVGKSSLINIFTNSNEMETGDVSEKIGRGRHTTRHSQLLSLGKNTFILDTPGFSSVFLPETPVLDIYKLFPEFVAPSFECRFVGCAHHKEPDCGVKNAVESGNIAESRYENYLQMYEEAITKKKY